MSAGEEGLVKVVAELKNAPLESEAFWARPLGDDLYELRNSPWCARDLHFFDVVRAIPKRKGARPRIVEVVRRSGHKTLRVMFPPETSQMERQDKLSELHKWRGYHESCDGRLFAVDVEPNGNYEAVCNQLARWQKEGRLVYESATTREGSYE